jgi:hypothetical protein
MATFHFYSAILRSSYLGRGQYFRLSLRDLANIGSLFASPRRHLPAGFGALAQFATGLWRRTDGEVTALGYSWPRLRASAVNFSANIFLLPVTLTTHKIITL